MHGFGGWSGCDPDGVRRQGAPHRGVGWGAGWAGSPGPGHPFGQGHVQGGPPPWLAGLFGLGRPEVRRGARVRRGDVRAAILAVLQAAAERGEPVNGYQVIQQIADRTGGTWRPSPGSVYPTIQQLEDEGLVEADDERGRRTLRLTESGTAYVAERAEELAAVWQPFEEAETAEGERQPPGLKPEIGQVMGAVWQILTTGSEAQRRAAAEVLVETRRQLYGILADGDGFDTDRDSAKEDRR